MISFPKYRKRRKLSLGSDQATLYKLSLIVILLNQQVLADNISVGNSVDLITAINNPAITQINLTNDITLANDLPTIDRNMVINGNNHILNGNDAHRGFVVFGQSQVDINNFTISHTLALGKNGGDSTPNTSIPLNLGLGGKVGEGSMPLSGVSGSDYESGGGGGGSGMGGGLFVHQNATVNLSNVSFETTAANGGNAGFPNPVVPNIARLVANFAVVNAEPIIAVEFGGGGQGGANCTKKVPNPFYNPNPDPNNPQLGNSEFNTVLSDCPKISFEGKNGSFGAGKGGGGGRLDSGGQPVKATNGSGGSAMGGAVFVMTGGKLNIKGSGTWSNGKVIGGSGDDANGKGYGGSLFIGSSGNGSASTTTTVKFTPAAGQVLIINDSITDGGLDFTHNFGRVEMDGDGTLVLNGTNSYFGGTNLNNGILSISRAENLGNGIGSINFNGGILQVTGNSFTGTSLFSHSSFWGAKGGGFDIANPANIFTVNDSLSGTGSFRKLGAGTLVLSGTNTYSGGTTVSGGILQGDTNSIQGDITNNASVVIDQTPLGTYSGNMSGIGKLIIQGNGGLTLTGHNTYSGGTNLFGGVLQGNSNSLQGDISNNSEVFFNQVATGTYSGNMSGTGSLTKDNKGTLVLTGNNTYSGGTDLNGGTLSVSSDNSLGTGPLNFDGGILQITGTTFKSTPRIIHWTDNGGVFDIADANNIFTVTQIIGRGLGQSCLERFCGSPGLSISGAGTLVLTADNTYINGTNLNSGILSVSKESNLGDATGALNFNGGILQITGNALHSTSRTINWGTGGGGFDIADSSNIFKLNQDIGPGGNLIKRGGGTLVLNGTNTYTGGTTVDAGNFQVGDDTHLNASILGPVTVNSASILSGHGTINGDVLNNGTLSPGGSIGTLTVNGNVTFAPTSIFNVEIDPNQASLLNVSGFAALNNANVSILAVPGTYTPRTYTILNAAGGVRGTFANLSLTNPIASRSLALLTPTLQFLPNRVDLSLSQVVDPIGALPHVDRHLARERNRIVSGRLNAPLGINCAENRFGFWTRGLGMLSYADANGITPKYEGGTGGVIMGFDHQFGEYLSLGIAGFTTNTDVTTFQLGNNKSNSDNAGASLYGVLTTGPWQLKTVLSYDNSSYSAQRGISSSVVQRSAQSKTHANQISNYNELSYAFKLGNLSLQPLAGMNLGWLRQNGFSEKGGVVGQNLSVDGRTLYTLDTFVGLKVRESVDINSLLKAQFELHALYDHDFSSLKESSLGRFDNGAVGLVKTADRLDQRDAGIIGASFSLLTADSLNFYLDYNGEIRSGQNSHFFNAGIRYVW